MERHRKGGKKKKERRKRRGPTGQGHVSGLSPPPNIFLPATQRLNNNNRLAPVDSQRRQFIMQRSWVKMQTKRGTHCHTLYPTFYSIIIYMFWPSEIRRIKTLPGLHHKESMTSSHVTINNNKVAWSWRRG